MYSVLTLNPRQRLCGNYDQSNWKGDSEVTWMFLESLQGFKTNKERHHEGKFVLFKKKKKKKKEGKRKHTPLSVATWSLWMLVSVIVHQYLTACMNVVPFSSQVSHEQLLIKKRTAWGSDLFLLQLPGALETCVKLSCTAYFPDIWPCRQSTDRSAPWREKVLSYEIGNFCEVQELICY